MAMNGLGDGSCAWGLARPRRERRGSTGPCQRLACAASARHSHFRAHRRRVDGRLPSALDGVGAASSSVFVLLFRVWPACEAYAARLNASLSVFVWCPRDLSREICIPTVAATWKARSASPRAKRETLGEPYLASHRCSLPLMVVYGVLITCPIRSCVTRSWVLPFAHPRARPESEGSCASS